MSKVPSNAMALEKTTLPSLVKSLLITADSDSDECSLCGNFFELTSSDLAQIRLPCVDKQCGPCASMWRMLNPAICLACYADFTCPKDATSAQMSSPHLNTDDRLGQQSSIGSQIESPLNSPNWYVASDGSDVISENDTNSDAGSPMREEDHQVTNVSEEDLREALKLANNRVGTNFSIQEIEADVSLDNLPTGTKTQLADHLTRLCIWKASESSEDDDAGDESSQQSHADNTSGAAPPQSGGTAASQGGSIRCILCRKPYRTAATMRRHLAAHKIGNRTCSLCGQVLGSAAGRRIHEKLHGETDGEREERLRKAKVARDRSRAGRGREEQKRQKNYRSDRVPQI